MFTLNYEEFDAFESKIDTEYFEIPSAKVILKKPVYSDEKQEELLNFVKKFDFIDITNNTNNPFNNYWLANKTRAFLTDINVRFEKEIGIVTTADHPTVVITDGLPENDQVIHIAETSFTISRFLNDPNLPRDKATRIYGDIVKNAFNKQGKYFALSQDDGKVNGFIQFSNNFITSSSTIELIAVDKDYKRQGIGLSMLQGMEQYIDTFGIKKIIVGTQLNNTSSVNFYFSNGFKYLNCNSIYHLWPEIFN